VTLHLVGYTCILEQKCTWHIKGAETGQTWIAVLILNHKYKLFITVVLYGKSIFSFLKPLFYVSPGLT
jgi:hypothetical protein